MTPTALRTWDGQVVTVQFRDTPTLAFLITLARAMRRQTARIYTTCPQDHACEALQPDGGVTWCHTCRLIRIPFDGGS